MLDYGDMLEWSRLYDLLLNRLGVCNQILGCRYAMAPDNPLTLRKSGSMYEVGFCGEVLADFKVWDLDGLRSVFGEMDTWSDCMWMLSRAGRLSVA
jgi:hypothetical protein